MATVIISEEKKYFGEDLEIDLIRSFCENSELTRATLTIVSSLRIVMVTVRCHATQAVLFSSEFNSVKRPPAISFLESEESGPYLVEVIRHH